MFKGFTDFFSKYRGYFVIFGGFLVELALGSFFTYGNIQQYIVLYMQNGSRSGDYVTTGNIVWIFGLLNFGIGMALSAGGFLEEKIGPLLTVLIGGCFYSLNVCLTYFTIKSYLVVIALSGGLFAGIGNGIAYGVALATPSKWFPNQTGLVMGVVVAGFGLSATLFDYLQMHFIKQTDDNSFKNLDKLPQSYYIMGLIYMAMIGIGSMFLKNPPDKSHESSDDTDDSYEPQISALLSRIQGENGRRINLKPHELFFELDFWILWMTFALNMACEILLNYLYKDFGSRINLTDNPPNHLLTIVSVTGALFNCAGRIFWGFVNDKKSYKTTMLTMTIATTVMYPTLYACSAIGNINTNDEKPRYIMYFVWIVLLNFFLSGNLSVYPSICANLFGMKHIIVNYGLLFTSVSFGSIITTVITTTLWSNKPSDIKFYLYSFIAGGVMSFMAVGLTFIYRGKSLIKYRL